MRSKTLWHMRLSKIALLAVTLSFLFAAAAVFSASSAIAAGSGYFTISASVTNSGGSISPTGTVTVAFGGIQGYTITMDPGYTVTDVLVDGVSVGAVTSYLFTNVQMDHTISASFGPVSATPTLTQTVVDTARNPVVGAQVIVVGSPSYQAVTDATGTFVLSVPQGVTLAYSISKTGFRTWYSESYLNLTSSIILGNRIIYTDADVSGWGVNPGYGALRGQALDAGTSQTINNPTVSAASMLYPGISYTVTYNSACGSGTGTCLYTVINVAANDAVLLMVSAPGYITKQVQLNPLPADAVGQAFANLEPSHSNDLSLTMTGGGSGTVTFSPGYNCSGTCRQAYSNGEMVTLTAAAAPDSSFSGWTGCDSMTGATCTVSMTSAQFVTAIFTRLSPGTGTISGKIIDSSGAAVAGVSVIVRREYESTSFCSGCRYGYTGFDGTYQINNVVPGTYLGQFLNQPVPLGTSGYTLVTSNQWYDKKHGMAAADLVAVNEGSSIELNALYPPFGQVSGTVTDTNSTGMPNVTIRVYDVDEQAMTDVALTDAAGNYTVQHLPSGTYKVRFMANSVLGPLPAQNLVTQVAYATVTAHGNVPGINATMIPGRSISGRITNRDGLPVVAYAIVIGPDGNNIASDQTNTTGAYTAIGIPPGNYKVLFRAAPFAGDTIDVSQLYSRRFYGGSADLDSASVVTVPADADVTNINGVLEATGPAIVPSGPPVIGLVSFMRDFGVEVVGMSSLRSFTLTNSGTADLILGALSKTGDYFSILNDRCSGVTLAPTKICTFQVAFAPGTEGATTGSVAVSSNDPDVPLLTIGLAGIGGAPNRNSGTTAVPYGDNVTAAPTADVNLTFASVTSAEGTVTAAAISTLTAPVPSNFQLLNGTSYDITTTASYSGTITVCITYDPATMANPANEHNLKMFHLSGAFWLDITTSVDMVSKKVCGVTNSLSPFLIAEPGEIFDGFFSPVNNLPLVNSAKAGQTIPVKWRVNDANGVPISDPASFKDLASYMINCSSLSGDPTSAIEEYAAGSSGLQYSGDGYWQFNWKTPKTYAGQCRTMVLTLGDGSTHTADFKFK